MFLRPHTHAEANDRSQTNCRSRSAVRCAMRAHHGEGFHTDGNLPTAVLK
jgi:hypothetical protein